MKQSKLLTIISVVGLVFLFCADLSFGSDLSELLKQSQLSLEKIPSLSYRVSCYEQDDPNPSSTLDWIELDKKYNYFFRQFDNQRRQNLALNASFDGKILMTASDDGKVIYIKECRENPLPDIFKSQQMLLAAYDFVLNDGSAVRWKQSELETLKDPRVWEELVRRTSFLPNEQVDEKLCKVLEVTGGRDRYSNSPIKYRVYIESTSGVPIAWKSYDASGAIQAEFSVTRQQTSKLAGVEKALVFPVEVEIKYFQKGRVEGKPELTNWQKFKFASIATADEAEIPLDVAEAEQISDLDKNVVINVPH